MTADAPATAEDREWMRRALALAQRGWGRVAPNPLVGAVIVRDGALAGQGWHTEHGRPHAEVEALGDAGEAARGATAYVTLEPCSHFGKTPPCTQALIAAGVARVVFAASDPNPKAAGGAEILRSAGIEVLGGVEAEAARDQNFAFFHGLSAAGDERPFVALKLALTLDARVADRDGRSVWITGEEAREEVHRLRAGFDAVAVGIGTALADDPLLTVRGSTEPRTPPTRIVFDRALRLPATSKMAATASASPVVIVAEAGASAERRRTLEGIGVRVVETERGGGIDSALRALRREGIRSVLVEGGAGIASALLGAGVVDRLYIFYAPLLLGPAGLPAFGGIGSPPIADAKRWRRLDTRAFGADTLITLARD
ncbi:MAG: riboflavin biosynthesis protein RibD [Gemmatimonadetes bacterium]|nr:riboflavin biosynthesis protein RibD [Gemmatimonadota bacterium]